MKKGPENTNFIVQFTVGELILASRAHKVRKMYGYPDKVSEGSRELVEEQTQVVRLMLKRFAWKIFFASLIVVPRFVMPLIVGDEKGNEPAVAESRPTEPTTAEIIKKGQVAIWKMEIAKKSDELLEMGYEGERVANIFSDLAVSGPHPAFNSTSTRNMRVASALVDNAAVLNSYRNGEERTEIVKKLATILERDAHLVKMWANIDGNTGFIEEASSLKNPRDFFVDKVVDSKVDGTEKWFADHRMPFFDAKKRVLKVHDYPRASGPLGNLKERQLSIEEVYAILMALNDVRVWQSKGEIDYTDESIFDLPLAIGDEKMTPEKARRDFLDLIGMFGVRLKPEMSKQELIAAGVEFVKLRDTESTAYDWEFWTYQFFRELLASKDDRLNPYRAKLMEIVKNPEVIRVGR